MPRKKHNIHYIYKTTCNVTNKFYVGMHSTSNLNDGYMGSGKRLRYSIRKYGVENHTKEILEYCDSREALVLREIEIVNSELIQDEMCMNLMCGGQGGFSSEEHRIKAQTAGNLIKNFKLKNDLEYRKRYVEKHAIKLKRYMDSGLHPFNGFKGKKHSDETKRAMSEKKQGYGIGTDNSQFGTCWVTNGVLNKKIYKGDEIPAGWKLGRKTKQIGIMNFICSHCGKPITGLSITVGRRIMHRECEIKPVSLELSEQIKEVLDFQDFMNEKFWEYSNIAMMIPKEYAGND